jgi:hypothetical protein
MLSDVLFVCMPPLRAREVRMEPRTSCRRTYAFGPTDAPHVSPCLQSHAQTSAVLRATSSWAASKVSWKGACAHSADLTRSLVKLLRYLVYRRTAAQCGNGEHQRRSELALRAANTVPKVIDGMALGAFLRSRMATDPLEHRQRQAAYFRCTV